ncbi:MAG: hypothetical protein ACTHMC_14250 [Pseudobacter sp.]|uniref:hypothetical protein n=1 Tax=Pseudobacter sp. TaxID=2045420 RepID=UPI003F817CF1
MNWGSGLGRVEHFKWVALGLIAGEGCDTNEKKREIRIYKVSKVDSAADRLVEVLPYKKNIPEFNAKWDFIKRYWEMNWKNFVE